MILDHFTARNKRPPRTMVATIFYGRTQPVRQLRISDGPMHRSAAIYPVAGWLAGSSTAPSTGRAATASRMGLKTLGSSEIVRAQRRTRSPSLPVRRRTADQRLGAHTYGHQISRSDP